MRFSTLVVTLLPAAGAFAAVHTISVGNDGQLRFDPPSVTAELDDTIKFEFKSKNHSVTQSTFDMPCMFKADGVDSGFQMTPPDATEFASWSFDIKATDPFWFFCAQTVPVNHCSQGMVFAVNPSANKTFDMFKTNAMSQGSAPSGNTTVSGSSNSGAAAPTGSTGTGGSPTTGGTAGAASTGSSTTSDSASGTADASKSNAASIMSRNGVALLSMAGLVLGLIL